jgi:hypothetical protein
MFCVATPDDGERTQAEENEGDKKVEFHIVRFQVWVCSSSSNMLCKATNP